MNERFKELMVQAIRECRPDDMDNGAKDKTLQRFAELIVKECANYINHRTEDWDSNLRWIFNDGSGYMEVDVDSLLNEHFGVEE